MSTETPTARRQLANLEDHFRAMESSDLRMDCLCLIAAGVDNANATLGWEKTEEHAALAIRSLECSLEGQSEEILTAFEKVGISF